MNGAGYGQRRSTLLLPLLAALGTLLIGITAYFTRPAIDAARHAQAQAVYFELLSLSPADHIALEAIATNDSALLGLRAPAQIQVAYRQNQNTREPIGLVLPLTARDGYNGDIDLLVAIDSSGRIVRVRALTHRETRGLGDAIDSDKSRWIEQFTGKTFDDSAVDQITGATITSRAVVESVRRALQYFAQHKDQLMHEASTGLQTETEAADGKN